MKKVRWESFLSKGVYQNLLEAFRMANLDSKLYIEGEIDFSNSFTKVLRLSLTIVAHHQLLLHKEICPLWIDPKMWVPLLFKLPLALIYNGIVAKCPIFLHFLNFLPLPWQWSVFCMAPHTIFTHLLLSLLCLHWLFLLPLAHPSHLNDFSSSACSIGSHCILSFHQGEPCPQLFAMRGHIALPFSKIDLGLILLSVLLILLLKASTHLCGSLEWNFASKMACLQIDCLKLCAVHGHHAHQLHPVPKWRIWTCFASALMVSIKPLIWNASLSSVSFVTMLYLMKCFFPWLETEKLLLCVLVN